METYLENSKLLNNNYYYDHSFYLFLNNNNNIRNDNIYNYIIYCIKQFFFKYFDSTDKLIKIYIVANANTYNILMENYYLITGDNLNNSKIDHDQSNSFNFNIKSETNEINNFFVIKLENNDKTLVNNNIEKIYEEAVLMNNSYNDFLIEDGDAFKKNILFIYEEKHLNNLLYLIGCEKLRWLEFGIFNNKLLLKTMIQLFKLKNNF